MSRTQQQCIADAIAHRIMANTRKRFSTLHADALEEQQMKFATNHGADSTPGPLTNDGSMNPSAPAEVQNVTAHRVDQKDLLTGQDTRSQAAPVVMPDNPAPRAETNDSENPGA